MEVPNGSDHDYDSVVPLDPSKNSLNNECGIIYLSLILAEIFYDRVACEV